MFPSFYPASRFLSSFQDRRGISGVFPASGLRHSPYAKAFTASNFLQLSSSIMAFHPHLCGHLCPWSTWSSPWCLLVPLVILWCGAFGQLGRQFLDNLYSRHTNGYPPRIAGFVKCISGQCPAPEYLPGSHGQGDKTPQYPAKPCPGWQYTGKDKIQTEREGKTRSSLHFCYICRITLHMPSNAYCQFVKQKVKT